MKKDIFNSDCYDTILRRIQDLKKDSQPIFGKMNVNQMLCHCADQLRMAMNFIIIPLEGNRISRYFKKQIALSFDSIPPEKIETLDQVNQEKEGTPPVGFEDDKVNLVKLLEYLTQSPDEYELQPHPMFGTLDKKQWGKLIFVHLDHHLKQFGV